MISVKRIVSYKLLIISLALSFYILVTVNLQYIPLFLIALLGAMHFHFEHIKDELSQYDSRRNE